MPRTGTSDTAPSLGGPRDADQESPYDFDAVASDPVTSLDSSRDNCPAPTRGFFFAAPRTPVLTVRGNRERQTWDAGATTKGRQGCGPDVEPLEQLRCH